MKASEMYLWFQEQRANGLTDRQIEKLHSNRPKIGDKKMFFGKLFIYSGTCWGLDEISHNVISEKNKGLKGYRIHSYSM